MGLNVLLGLCLLSLALLSRAAADDINAKCTAELHNAAVSGDLVSFEANLNRGENVNCEMRGMTALIFIAYKGHLKLAESLINAGAKLDLRSQEESATALIVASTYGHRNIVDALIKGGSGLDLQDKLGYTAVMMAASKGHGGIVDSLVNAGANLNIKSERGETALKLATAKGHRAIVVSLKRVRKSADL
jgi:ankyrin repeat protein